MLKIVRDWDQKGAIIKLQRIFKLRQGMENLLFTIYAPVVRDIKFDTLRLIRHIEKAKRGCKGSEKAHRRRAGKGCEGKKEVLISKSWYRAFEENAAWW